MLNWSGHSAIVTGGASGLGEATSRKLASEGVNVMIFDLNEDAGQTLAAELGGGFAKVDVSDRASVSDGIKAAKDRFGSPRILVNCAGIAGAAKTVS